MNITRTSMVSSLDGLIQNHNAHPSFRSLADLQVQFNHVAAVIVFFSWVKVGLRTQKPLQDKHTGRSDLTVDSGPSQPITKLYTSQLMECSFK